VSFSISPQTHATHDVIGDRSCSSCSASLVCFFSPESVLTDDRSLLLLQVGATGYKHCQWVVLHNIL
jgi:hypothetical protein